jgi:hypothetical protein
MRDDGYHYISDKLANVVNSGLYTENWYFEFRSDELTFYTSFEVNNPAEVADAPLSPLAYSYASIIIDNEIVVDTGFVTTPYALSEFSASPKKLDVKIGNNYAKAQSVDTIVTAGVDRDNGVSWNLKFKAKSIDQTAIHNTQMGFYDTDRMNWFSMMPVAKVTGTVSYNGQTWEVNTNEGYHDHNWGDPETFALNPWSKFYAGDCKHSLFVSGIVVPDPMTFETLGSFFFVNIDGRYQNMQMASIEYTSFDIDMNTGMMYVSGFHVVLENEKYLIDYTSDDGDNAFFASVEPYAGYNLYFQNALSYRADGVLYQKTRCDTLKTLLEFSAFSTVEQLIIQ